MHPLSDVSIVPCADYNPDTVTEALDALLDSFDALDWIQPGMKIAVKTNLVTALRPEAAGTTHPTLLAALTRQLRRRGAEVILGDSPGGPYTSAWLSHVYHTAGMQAVQEAGGILNRDFSQAQASFPQAYRAKSFQYTAYLDQADAIINVCKLKSHGMMGMSAAVKNMFGAVPGTLKPEYHFQYPTPQDFAHMLIDLNEYFKPRLCIADAVIGMEGNGPTKGTPRLIGALAASFSPYLLDLAAAKIIGLTMRDVPTLDAAYQRELAPADADELSISGDLSRFIVADYDRILNRNSLLFRDDHSGLFGKVYSWAAQAVLASTPSPVPSMCTGCGKCAEICPAHAIEMKSRLPHIRRKTCIRCFCCQEFCPAGAMVVNRTSIAKLLNR